MKKSGSPGKLRESIVHLLFSIRGALSLVGLAAVAPALAIIIFSGLEHGSMLEQAVRDDVRRQAETFAQIQDQITTSVEQTLSTIAAVQAFQESQPERQAAVMQRVLEQNPEYVNVSYTDTRGIVQASPQLELGTNLGDRKHIREVLAGARFAVGEHVVSRFGQQESLSFAHAIRDEQGRTLGALGLVYSLRSYAEIFTQLDYPPDSTLSLLDHRGITLFSYPAASGEVGALGAPWATDGLDSPDPLHSSATYHPPAGSTAVEGSDGVRRFYAVRSVYLPQQDTPYLTVLLGVPEERARAPMIATLRRNTLLMAGVIAAALILAQLFGNLVFGRRLRRLSYAAEQISQGRLSTEFDLPSDPSEIGRLGQQMKSMADALEARRRERDLTEKSLQESIYQKDTLLREVHHRVKNNLQLILSLVRLQRSQETHAGENAVSYDGFTHGLEGRLAAMSEVHEMLYADVDVSEIQLDQFIPRLSRVIRSIYGRLDPVFYLDPVALPLEQAIPVGLIVNEFLTNAYRHGGALGDAAQAQPEIYLTHQGNTVTLEVRDFGPGLPPTFHPANSAGLGCTLVQSLAGQLRGTAAWTNASAGTTAGTSATLQFTLEFKT